MNSNPTALADLDFSHYEPASDESRAAFLEQIGDELLALGDELLETAHQETNLPLARLTGERGRTVGQLKLFANFIRQSNWRGDIVELAEPERAPLPKPELRQTHVPIGPVAVFGASNFPLAFSVPGGDTASALAAGCPVVAKAHPAHPQTSQLCAEAILRAAEKTEQPAGTFAMVEGGVEAGQALVNHPQIRAVAFTGSHHGGRALFNAAAARPVPIPVFAEMGSTNPVFVFPGALKDGGEGFAKAYVASLTLGVGQFCTNPGILIAVDGPELDSFLAQASEHLCQVALPPMLHEGIQAAYDRAVTERLAAGVEPVVAEQGLNVALFATDSDSLRYRPELREEIFGPAGLIVRARSTAEFIEIARTLEGQLTATVHFAPSERDEAVSLAQKLAKIAGRVIANGWPTGVEVSAAMQHGGPYPATTDSRFTSVGTAAIWRFLRPVCFQDF